MAERHQVLKREKRVSKDIVIQQKGYYVELEDKSKVWKRDQVLVDLEGHVLVTLDTNIIEPLIRAAFQNKSKRAVRGGVTVSVLNCQEVPGSRRERTV